MARKMAKKKSLVQVLDTRNVIIDSRKYVKNN